MSLKRNKNIKNIIRSEFFKKKSLQENHQITTNFRDQNN